MLPCKRFHCFPPKHPQILSMVLRDACSPVYDDISWLIQQSEQLLSSLRVQQTENLLMSPQRFSKGDRLWNYFTCRQLGTYILVYTFMNSSSCKREFWVTRNWGPKSFTLYRVQITLLSKVSKYANVLWQKTLPSTL